VGTDKRERQKANRQLKYQQQAKEVSRQRLTKRVLIGGGAAVALLIFILVLAWIVNRNSDDDDTSTSTTVAAAASVPATTTDASTTTAAAGSTTSTAEGSTTTGSSTAAAAFAYGTGPCPPAEGAPTPVKTFTAAPQQCIDPTKTYTATIATDHGDIVITLDPAAAPGTVNNFVTLARYGYYDDTRIFRTASSVAGEIIQGGGRDGSADPGYSIPDEGSGFVYEAGQIAMARTGAPNSAGGQWFFVTDPPATPDPTGTYVVFGEITEGLDVARAIRALGGDQGAPSPPVTVESVEITET
jgi:cyclophilin family peptidyl-prolyl cis-trans isomerase